MTFVELEETKDSFKVSQKTKSLRAEHNSECVSIFFQNFQIAKL